MSLHLNHVGRRRIYTDEKVIDASNVVKVLNTAYSDHCANVMDINFLVDYEAGIHPAIQSRVKTIRPEVDYKVTDNIAHYVTRFHVGYFWGTPAMYIQRGNEEIHVSDRHIDDKGIAGLNEMLRNGEDISYKRQHVAKYVEKVGLGYSMIDIMTADEFDDDFILKKTDRKTNKEYYVGSLCHVYALDARTTFCVYQNGIGNKLMMGVTYVKRKDASVKYTCYTDTDIFEIRNGEIINQSINPFMEVPIVEWNRDTDITGCFEHCLDDMDALDAQSSDMANDSTQRTQEIWWSHNVSFTDENGEVHEPKSGEWVQTFTPQGLNNRASDAKIAPLSSTFDGASAQSQLYRKFNHILQKCYVPIQSESSGGGSTGSAMDMSAGWSAAELDALEEQNTIELAARRELKLILKAIRFVPESVLPIDDPVRQVHHTDIDIHFSRRRNYDLSVKANALATLVGRGIHPRHAIKAVEIFEDSEQVWNDSQEMMMEYQKKVCVQEPTQNGGQALDAEKPLGEDDRILQDLSDQTSNSPRLREGV